MQSRTRTLVLLTAFAILLPAASALAADALGVVPVLVQPMWVLFCIIPAVAVAVLRILLKVFTVKTLLQTPHLLWRQKITILVIAGLVTGSIYLKAAIFPPKTGDVHKPEAGDNFNMFRGNEGRTGVADKNPGPAIGGINWALVNDPAGKKMKLLSTPAVVGNRVFISVVSNLGQFNQLGDGYIMCLDADTGGVVWATRPGENYRGTFSSPSVEGDYLVVGEGLHKVSDARVTCLNKNDGKVIWTFRTRNHVESTPCIASNKVYVGAGDDGYYCLDLAGNGDGTTKVIWHKGGKEADGSDRPDAPQYRDCESCPVVINGRFYADLGNNGQAVICLNADTGEEIWRQPTPYPVFGPPAIVGGKLYVGMGVGDFVNDAEVYMDEKAKAMKAAGKSQAEIDEAVAKLKPIGEVWCLDTENGKVNWTFKTKRTILGAVAVRDSKLYFGSRDGILYCLSTEGKPLAQWNAQGSLMTSPAVTKDHVYCVTGKGKLFALSADDLQPTGWMVTVGPAEQNYFSSPTIARGHIYVGADEQGLLCIGQPQDARKDPLWPGHMGGGSGTIDPTMLPERGSFDWGYPLEDSNISASECPVTAPAASIGQGTLIPLADGPVKGLVCVVTDDKAQPAQKWQYSPANGVSISPAAYADKVFVVDGKPGQAGRKLACLSAFDGKIAWSSDVAADAEGSLLLEKDRLFVSDQPESVACFDHDGKLLWREKVGKTVGNFAAGEMMLFVSLAGTSEVAALDTITGRQLYRAPLDAPATTGPVFTRDGLLVGTQKGIQALAFSDGRALWASQTGTVDGSFAVEKKIISYVTPNGKLIVLSNTGQLLASANDATPGFPPLLSSGAGLYVADMEIKRFVLPEVDAQASSQPTTASAPAFKTTSWLKLKATWPGKPTSPLIQSNSLIFFGTDKRGLVCAKPAK